MFHGSAMVHPSWSRDMVLVLVMDGFLLAYGLKGYPENFRKLGPKGCSVYMENIQITTSFN